MDQNGRIFTTEEAADMLSVRASTLKKLHKLGVIPFVNLKEGKKYLSEETTLLMLSCPYRWNSRAGKEWLLKKRPANMVVYCGEDLGVE